MRTAKVKFGTPVDEPANRLVIRKYVSDMMEERGLRPSHIMTYLDLVVELVFVPSESEVQARRLRTSRAWRDRHSFYKNALSAAPRRGWFDWLSDAPRWEGRSGR